MLRFSLTEQVYSKYKLDECERFNPFYKVISKDLPTVILKDFLQRKFNNDDRVSDFVNEGCKCVYNQETNSLKIYHFGDDTL